MRRSLRSLFAGSGIALMLLASGCFVGCGGSDGNVEPVPEDDTGLADGADTGGGDSTAETAGETGADTGSGETSDDTGSGETSDDAGDSGGGETSGDTGGGETSSDSAVDTTPVDTGCTGPLCVDLSLCVSGSCVPCTTDTECSTAKAGTICVGGKCLSGTCKPKSGSTPSSGCTAPATCCASSTATACQSPTVTGATACCDDTDCSGKTSFCDTTTPSCVCPAPVADVWRVASTGSDTDGPLTANGSAACPFKTITHALTKVIGKTTPQTVVLTSTAIYGSGCDGGAPCDVTPIRLTDGVPAGSVITGNGLGPDVTVQSPALAPAPGGLAAVFAVASKGISFKNMVIKPGYSVAGGGAHGIVFTGPLNTGSSEGTISNVTITGINTGTASTGNGIWFNAAGTSPTIGSGVTITGGLHSVYVQGGTSAPTFTGTSAAPSLFSGSNQSCVRADSASTTNAPKLTFTTSTAGTPTVTVRDCGVFGGVVIDTAFGGTASSIDRLTIFKGVSGGAFTGIHLLTRGTATVSNTSITGLTGRGIIVEGGGGLVAGSSLTLSSSTVTGNTAGGILIQGTSKADISSTTATGNGGDNVSCTGGSVKLRSSTLTGSTGGAGLGLRPPPGGGVSSCAADLGSSTDAGKNVFNKTSSKNAQSGICIATGTPATTASDSSWSCDYSPSGCTAATTTLKPTVALVCGGADIGGAGSGSVTASLPQTCWY